VQVAPDAEGRRLRAVLRDLVALSAIPTAWIGSEPSTVAAGLADALVHLLQLDFAYVRLSDPGGAGTVEVARGNAWTSLSEWLEGHRVTSAPLSRKEIVPDASDDSARRHGIAVPVGVNGEGGAVVAAAERSDFPTSTDELLLSLAANHAAGAFQSARLVQERKQAEEELRDARNELEVKVIERTAELHLANEELATSRRRIVSASDEARRRIERDLHDGTQQRLVSLGLALRAVEAKVPADGNDFRSELSRIAAGLTDAVEDLQEMSRGIHPAILSQGGLGPALRTLARRSAIPVELDVTTDARLPESIEVAAYFVVSEALANAAKHAQASQIGISLVAGEGRLLVSIRDDGVGGADPQRGTGLVGLTDRVEALGGSIRVSSPPGDGTKLIATLPLDLESTEDVD
jgi:signal transduction histidine kinase